MLDRARVLRAALRRFRTEDPTGFRVSSLLGVLALLLLARLVFGDNPWEDGIAQRLREGKPPRPVDYARTYGWWGATANLGLCLALLATRRLWLIPDPLSEAARSPSRSPSRTFLVGIAGAMLTLAVLGLPRLSHSFWDDEEYGVRHAIAGAYERGRDGKLEFDRVRWRDTLWHYHKPSNHVPQSILSRLSVDAWRLVARPPLRFASETATRAPVWLAGLAAIGAVALLLWQLGHPLAGVCAAWVLALHPWHLRYATEARGYALLCLLVPLTLLLLVRAVARGSWPRWLLYGLSQYLLLWSFPGALVLLVVLNAVAGVWLWRETRGSPRRRPQVTRFALSIVIGAMWALWLMLPNVAQLRVFLARGDLAAFDAAGFLPEVLSHLWIGTPWRIAFESERYVDAAALAARGPGLFDAVLAATIALTLAGAVRLLAAGGPRRWVGLILLLPGPLTFCGAWLRGTFLNQWYLIFVLPSFAVCLGLGLEGPLRWLRPPARGAALAAAVAGIYLGSYAWLTQPARESLRRLPLQPVRESVELTRSDRDPFSPQNERILTASFQAPPSYYDPLVHEISTPEELAALMRRADAEGAALYVNIGRPRLARARAPELVAALEHTELFEKVAELFGSSPRGVRRVYRYRGGS